MNEVVSKALFEDQVAALTCRLLALRQWEVMVRAYPLLEIVFRVEGREPLLLQMRFDQWNALPPSIQMLTTNREPLQKPLQGGPGIFHAGPHPDTGKPFICMAGTREYHTHPSHLNDLWDHRRGLEDFSIGGLLTQIWNGWLRTPQ